MIIIKATKIPYADVDVGGCRERGALIHCRWECKLR
jgi:hypothetical protein